MTTQQAFSKQQTSIVLSSSCLSGLTKSESKVCLSTPDSRITAHPIHSEGSMSAFVRCNAPQYQAKRRLVLGANAMVSDVACEVPVATSFRDVHGFQTPHTRKRRSSTISSSTDSNSRSPLLGSVVMGSPLGDEASPSANNRFDNSLNVLTRKFMSMLARSPQGVVNLNDVCAHLNVQKRRVYDITNVLEGIDMVEKLGKNSLRWKYTSMQDQQCAARCEVLTEEIRDLEQQEVELDSLLAFMQQEFENTTRDEDSQLYAYVRYQDVRNKVPEFNEHIVIAVKAPTDTLVEVQDPRLTGVRQMHIQSTGGEIDVFVCPEETAAVGPMCTSSNDKMAAYGTLETNKADTYHAAAASALTVTQANGRESSAQLTVQPTHMQETIKLEDGPYGQLPFLPLEPLGGADDFNFALGPDEGLTDLFDPLTFDLTLNDVMGSSTVSSFC